jgi:hypothetical protein
MTLHPIPLNFLILYMRKISFSFFISDRYKEKEQMTKIIDRFSKKQEQVCEMEKVKVILNYIRLVYK